MDVRLVRAGRRHDGDYDPAENLEEPLLTACRVGCLSVVRFILESRNLQAVPQEALHLAVTSGNLELLRFMVEHCVQHVPGFQVEAPWREQNTLLHSACEIGNLEMVRFLVEYFDVNDLEEPLIAACRVGWLSVVRFILESRNLQAVPHEALHLAVTRGNLELLRFMVQHCVQHVPGFQVDAPWREQNTLLHSACAMWIGNLEMVRFLVEYIDVNVAYRDGATPLHNACWTRNMGIVQFLVEECNADVGKRRGGEGTTPLHLAAHQGSQEIVAYLIQQGANVDEEDGIGETALHKACRNGSLQMVRFLVEEHNANVEQASRRGWTALFYASHGCRLGWASYRSHLNMVRFLVEECGADVMVADKVRRTPLTVRLGPYRSFGGDSDDFQRLKGFLRSLALPLAAPAQDGDMSEPSVRVNPHLCDRHRLFAENTLDLLKEVMPLDDTVSSVIAYYVMGYLSPPHVAKLRDEDVG